MALLKINKLKSSLICTSNDFISGILNNMSLLHYEQFWFQKRPFKLFRNKRFTLQNLFYFWHKKTNIVCICFSFHATFFAQWLPTLAKKWRTKTSYIWYSKNIEMFCKDISSDINLLYLKGMQFLQIFKVAAFGIKNVHSLLLHEIFYQCIYFQKILSTSSVHSNCIL